MAIDDMWVSKRTKQHTDRYGKGLRYRVRVPGHPAKSYRTRDAALRAEAILRTEKVRPHARMTVGRALDLWLAGKKGLTTRGYEAAKNAHAHAYAHWSGLMCDQVRGYDVQAWLVGLDLGPASQSKILQAISGAMKVAVQAGAVDANPCDGVKVGKGDRRGPMFLDVAGLEKVAAECGTYAPMVWLLGTCGLRIGECCRLDVGDVTVRTRRLHVRKSKNGQPRDVPIPRAVLAKLDLTRPKDSPLFTAARGGRIDQRRWSSDVWRPARVRAGFPGLHVHDLRHTAASLMIASGATPKDVQRALGHKSAAMTLDLYAGHWDKALDDVGERMGRMIDG